MDRRYAYLGMLMVKEALRDDPFLFCVGMGGVGQALLEHAFRAWYDAGKRRVGLGGDSENPTGAVRLYERVGMAPAIDEIHQGFMNSPPHRANIMSPKYNAVGFGISTPEQFAAVGEFADGAVVGSALVHTIERNPGKEPESVAQFIRELLVIGRRSSVLSARS